MNSAYDVVLIGAGPAGIFTALELTRPWGAQTNSLRIAMVEKGPELHKRVCPVQAKESKCTRCKPCFLLSGWGGAGAFSDGKLTLSTEVGGWLQDYVGRSELKELISYVDSIYVHFGAPQKLFGADDQSLIELTKRAATADLILVASCVRHLGTDNCVRILQGMRETLAKRVDIFTGSEAVEIVVQNNAVRGVKLRDGKVLHAKYVVCAPGREGADWFSREITRLGLNLAANPVDIGVRVEVPAVLVQDLTDKLYEFKLIYYSKTFDDQVRSFCVCPGGEVVVENNDGLVTVNGHSYAEKRTDLTNFALLVSKSFTEPFREPLAYGKYIASLANMLGGGVIVQRLGDLLAGRRSTDKRLARGMVVPTLKEATPGDLSLVLPYRYLTGILEMLQALDKVAPGVYARHTLLYGVEAKFYSSRPELSVNLETPVHNLFAGGDGAGVTRGLVQASASGVIIAREIKRREHKHV